MRAVRTGQSSTRFSSASSPGKQTEGSTLQQHKKLIFLHIPKTAGTSLRTLVEQAYPAGACVDIYTANSADFYKTIRHDVDKAEVLYGHTSYGIHQWFGLEPRYIAFVRNPIARVVSLYNHLRRHKKSPHDTDINAGGMTLRDMVQAEISVETNNHMVRIIGGYGGTETIDNTTILDNAITHIEQHFEFVGLTERMPESVDILAQRLGWGRQLRIPRLNITPPFPEIDAATITTIKEYNRLDLILYEYVEKHFPLHPDPFNGLRNGLFNRLGRQVRKFFGSGHTRPGGLRSPELFQTRPYADLVGQPISKFPIQEAESLAVRVDTPHASTPSDPQGSIAPAYITGRIQSEQTPLNPPPLALAINGTIRSLTQPWTFPVNGQYGRWCTVVPEAAFHPARNTIEPFSVSVEAGRIVLLRPTAPFQNLAQDSPGTGEELVSPHGHKVRVEPSSLQGWVDRAKLDQQQLELVGWAADIRNTSLPQAVWVVVNGRLIHTGQTTVSRPDVVATLKTAGFQQAGFFFTLALEETADLGVQDLEVRVFAVSKDGVASELCYPPDYPWRQKPSFKPSP